MVSDGVIFIHNQMDPENPRVDVVPVADHVVRWAQGTRRVDEEMLYDIVLVERDMAQVWGPYTFWVEDVITHCGAYYRDASFHTWHSFATTRALENQVFGYFLPCLASC